MVYSVHSLDSMVSYFRLTFTWRSKTLKARSPFMRRAHLMSSCRWVLADRINASRKRGDVCVCVHARYAHRHLQSTAISAPGSRNREMRVFFRRRSKVPTLWCRSHRRHAVAAAEVRQSLDGRGWLVKPDRGWKSSKS
jgi:hypothetical protein